MRLRMLAAHHMDNARKLFTQRGMYGYVGSYNGIEIAAISCGFGEASAKLYLAEACELGGGNFIYLGECVSLSPKVPLMEVLYADGSSERILNKARPEAKKRGVALYAARVHTDDAYWLTGKVPEGAVIVDFVSRGFLETAGDLGAEAFVLLTVCENAATNEAVHESQRQSGFHAASLLAFETFGS